MLEFDAGDLLAHAVYWNILLTELIAWFKFSTCVLGIFVLVLLISNRTRYLSLIFVGVLLSLLTPVIGISCWVIHVLYTS